MSAPAPTTAMAARRRQNRVLLAAVLGTTASVFPAFLTAAVAVQLAADLGLTEAGLGVAIGVSFASAAIASTGLGRVAERLGAVTAMRVGLGLTAVTGAMLAFAVNSTAALIAALAVAGVSNALTQPAANLLLAGLLPEERLGVAFAVKQAGMPLATLLGGLAVPAIALTVGWRPAYLTGIALAAFAQVALARATPVRSSSADVAEVVRERPPSGIPDLPTQVLLRYAVVGLLGAATAGAMVSFIVTAAVAAGLAPGAAGLLLTGGSLVGVTSRLLHGVYADRGSFRPIRRVTLLLGVGAVGLGAMAVHQPAAYVLGVLPAFAAGWSWPGLFNLSVVRWNPSAPAAATGVTQTGVYIGAGGGPVVGGLLIGTFGYPTFWLVCAASLALSSLLAFDLRRRLIARSAAGGRQLPGVV